MFEISAKSPRNIPVSFMLTQEEFEEIYNQRMKFDCNRSDFLRLCIGEFVKQHPLKG